MGNKERDIATVVRVGVPGTPTEYTIALNNTQAHMLMLWFQELDRTNQQYE